MPFQLNWWIGGIFSLGAALFVVASLLGLFPAIASWLPFPLPTVNAIYFAGSIPFSVAAYLQLLQAAHSTPFENTAGEASKGLRLIGWKPRELGWLSCLLQFLGTILFNINTFDAMIPSLGWIQYELLVWVPNLLGSMLFLVSGYLAFLEVCHRVWAWIPRSIAWWIVWVNLLGCVAFLVSSFLSNVVPGDPQPRMEMAAIAMTLLGACSFLAGSLLMLVESVVGMGTGLGAERN